MMSPLMLASHKKDSIQARLNRVLHTAAEGIRTDLADAQETQARLEAQIEELVRANPHWLGGKKQIKTPFGVVKFTASTSLEASNEQHSIEMIRKHLPADADFFVRTKEELNLQALAQLDDESLTKLRIFRISDDKFSLAVAHVDLGKVVLAGAVDGSEARV